MATPVPAGTTLAPPLAPIIASDFSASDTLLTMGDLILRNPIQSTAIFFMIILASTGLEYTFELLDHQRNAYHRNIILSTKEELAAVAFSQMVLIFVSLVVGFSDTAKAVILLATLMIVYMCVNFSIYVVMVNVLQSRRALEWNYFEWGRLDMDALHTKQEALFKSAREVFLRRAKVGAKVKSVLSENKEAPTSIMPVLFASYLGHVERSYLKESFDFTWVTWTALIGIVVADGLRSITVNSLGSGATNIAITQVLTFVFVIGWGLLALLILVSYIQHKKIVRYINQWNLTSSFADVTAASAAASSSLRASKGSYNRIDLDEQDDAAEKKIKSDEELVEGLVQNFYFSSPGGSLSVLQVLMLGLLWFTCVFCVGMVHFSWVHMGAYALFVYVAAAVPFFAAVLYFLPKALTDIFIAASISTDFNDELITLSVNGQYDLRQVEEDESDGDDNDGDNAGSQLLQQGSGHKTFIPGTRGASLERSLVDGARDGSGGGGGGTSGGSTAHHGEFDDEIDAPLEMVALGSGRTGAAPLRIQGIPASHRDYNSPSARPGQFMWGPRRPIFTAPMGADVSPVHL